MITNTKSLFASVLKALNADCVCDIGSRDGDQSLLFHHLLPSARVLAFEANPINFEMMQAKPSLQGTGIEIFPYAISNRRGTAQFHVIDVDYSDPEANRGTSSLLRAKGQRIRQTVEVETHRIDEFILARYPDRRRIGLWIDVEGAEHAVLESATGIKDRIVAINVETMNTPQWEGQKSFRDVKALMDANEFVLCGANFGSDPQAWGDVVFVPRRVLEELGARFSVCKAKAYASYWLRADHLAVFLKRRAPWLYHALRRLYIRFGT